MIVYVVLGESGDYSDRSVWVSGVFESEDAAKDAIYRRGIVRRTYLQWLIARQSEMDKQTFPLRDGFKEDRLAAAEKVVGPEPEYEGAEQFEIVEATLGEWSNSL